MSGWKEVKDNPPPEGVLVECTTPTGNVVELRRQKNLYFSGDMYVYYLPIMWREKS